MSCRRVSALCPHMVQHARVRELHATEASGVPLEMPHGDVPAWKGAHTYWPSCLLLQEKTTVLGALSTTGHTLDDAGWKPGARGRAAERSASPAPHRRGERARKGPGEENQPREVTLTFRPDTGLP